MTATYGSSTHHGCAAGKFLTESQYIKIFPMTIDLVAWVDGIGKDGAVAGFVHRPLGAWTNLSMASGSQ
jgi:hypothetical protein